MQYVYLLYRDRTLVAGPFDGQNHANRQAATTIIPILSARIQHTINSVDIE